MTEPGRLERIWIKRFKRGPMDPVDGATVVADRGLEGNADQGGFRQVTLIERRAWEAALADLGVTEEQVPPTSRRANLLVADIELAHSRDRVLQVGDVRIRIGGETTPCRLMDEMYPGLQEALRPDWRAGAFGVALDSGEICIGDRVRWLEEG